MPAEALPSREAAVAPEWRCDTGDLLMIHRFLRGLFRDAVTLVERVADGDRRTTKRVAKHLLQVAHVLHGHHHGEDLYVWDDLERRAPACALHVVQMREQHVEISDLLSELEAFVAAWRMSPTASARDAVARSLRRLNATLDRHLGAEEEQILPTAAVSFTQREWDRLAEHGRRDVPPRWAFMQLGFMLDSMPADEASAFLAALPKPLPLIWSAIGRRIYRRGRARLYGSPDPVIREETT